MWGAEHIFQADGSRHYSYGNISALLFYPEYEFISRVFPLKFYFQNSRVQGSMTDWSYLQKKKKILKIPLQTSCGENATNAVSVQGTWTHDLIQLGIKDSHDAVGNVLANTSIFHGSTFRVISTGATVKHANMWLIIWNEFQLPTTILSRLVMPSSSMRRMFLSCLGQDTCFK